MHKVSRRAARLSAVTRAASAMEIDAPGCTPYPAQRCGISDNSVALRVLSDACPSSGLPQIGPARATHRGERTHCLRSGRFSWLSP
jgi:hypothetical protein